MSPEEKAKELVEKFKKYSHSNWDEKTGFDDASNFFTAKQCAIICCDEILEAGAGDYDVGEDLVSGRTYWEQVKTEIQKL